MNLSTKPVTQKANILRMFLLGAFLTFGSYSSFAISSEQSTAESNVLSLNNEMFTIYNKEHMKFKAKLMGEVPVIVARFSGAGGHFTLYRPGKSPLVAPPAPLKYQLTKSIGHSAMVTYEMSGPYVDSSKTDKDWQIEMKVFQGKLQTALTGINKLELSNSEKELYTNVLKIINQFLTKSLKQGFIQKDDLDNYAKIIAPYIPKLIQVAAKVQVQHQMAVIASWKKLLGDDWKKTYAMTNSIYVARQNNMLFSMLAEFMGKEAINHRLFLFETTSFTTTDDDLLNLWSQIISDRHLSDTLFGDHYLMDSELIANGGRQIIVDEAAKYGLPEILPPEENFDSTDWPWRHNPSIGSGAGQLSQEKKL